MIAALSSPSTLGQQHDHVAVGVPHRGGLPTVLKSHDSRQDEGHLGRLKPGHKPCEIVHPMDLADGGNIIGLDFGSRFSARRRPVVQQLHMGRGRGYRLKRHHIDLDPGKPIEPVLLRPCVQGAPAHMEAQQVGIEGKAPIRSVTEIAVWS